MMNRWVRVATTSASLTLLLYVFLFQGERMVEDGLMGEVGHRLHLSITLLLYVFLFCSRRGEGWGGHRLHLSMTLLRSFFLFQG